MNNVFLLGAMKAGTTSLFNLLSKSPHIYESNPKEPTYYNTNEFRFPHREHMNARYLHHFRRDSGKSDGMIYLEGNNMNFICKYVAKRIKIHHPDAKFILIVRDPLFRAYSHWNMQYNYRPGYTFSTFETALSANLNIFDPNVFTFESERMATFDGYNECYRPTLIEHGLYYQNIMPYVEEFGLDKIHIISFNCIATDCKKMRLELFEFLDVPYIDEPMPWARKEDTFIVDLTTSNVRKAIDIWKEDSEKFSDLVKIDFVGEWYGK